MNRAVLLVLGMGLVVPGLLIAGVDTAWVRRYDGPAHGGDIATGLTVDSAGNVYVVGGSTGVGTGGDCVTIKYYPNGDTAWVRRADFGGKDLPSGLGVDAQGNVYVTGTNNDSRMFTVKYSPAGNRLWYEFFGSQGGASDLVLDSHGDILVCGSSYRASSDAAAVKYRPNGDTAWARYYDWEGYEDYAQAIACGQANDPAMAGYGAGATSHYDCITVLYDSSGGPLWASVYDGPNHGDDRSCDVAASSSGNVVTTGRTDDGYTTPPDYLTILLSSQGETLWTRTYDGPDRDWDEAAAVALDFDNNAYVTGYSHGYSTNDDYVTVKYDLAGTQVWLARFDGPAGGPDHARAIAVDRQGNAYVAGSARIQQSLVGCAAVKYDSSGDSVWVATYTTPTGTVSYGTKIAVGIDGCVYVAGIGDNDILTIKYVQDAGVAEESHAPVALRHSLIAEPSVFGSRTVLHFCTGRSAAGRISVYDAEGRRVRRLLGGSRVIGTASATWDGCDERGMRLSPSVYIVVLEAGEERAQVKVVMSE